MYLMCCCDTAASRPGAPGSRQGYRDREAGVNPKIELYLLTGTARADPTRAERPVGYGRVTASAVHVTGIGGALVGVVAVERASASGRERRGELRIERTDTADAG